MKGEIRTYRDLIAWQRTFDLGKRGHTPARQDPRGELFLLTSQTRRAGTSIAMNIAEGYGRGTLRDCVRFRKIARGSRLELGTALLFARDFGCIPPCEFDPTDDLLKASERVLAGPIRSLERA